MTIETTPRRRVAKAPEDRRDELLAAAGALFRQKGVAATTVSEITEGAGVAKGTFYLYFDSKDHVVAALYEQLCAGMGDLFAEALAQLDGGDYWGLVDEITANCIDYWIGQRDTLRALIAAGERLEVSQLIAESDERVIAMMEAGIQLGVERGLVRVADPHTAAQVLYYGLQGTTHSVLLGEGDIDRDHLVTACQELVRKLLAP